MRRRVCCFLLSLIFFSTSGGGLITLADCHAFASTTVGTISIPIFDIAGLLARLFPKSSRQRQQETTASRSSRVSNISINPAKIVGYQGQLISLSAIGKDGAGEIVQGGALQLVHIGLD